MTWLLSAEEMIARRNKQRDCDHKWSYMGTSLFPYSATIDFVCLTCDLVDHVLLELGDDIEAVFAAAAEKHGLKLNAR